MFENQDINNNFGLYRQSLNDLSFWYPILMKINIPTPRTVVLPNNIDWRYLLDGNISQEIELFIAKISDIIEKYFSYPVFIKTGLTSGKHDWKDSCYLTKKEDITSHLYTLFERSVLLDFSIPPSMKTIVVRELIETTPIFHAFRNMPITKEIRAFIKDGETVSLHSYRPNEAFKNESGITAQDLYKLNNFSKTDIESVKKMSDFIAKNFMGYWSVDFLQDKKGNWRCIDMALGDDSYQDLKKIG